MHLNKFNIFLFGYTSTLGKQILIDLNNKFKESNFFLFSKNILDSSQISEKNENKCTIIKLDLSNTEHTKEVIIEAQKLCKNKIDIIVFCSISKTNSPFNDIEESKIINDININIISQILIIKSILPLMENKNFGHIVNISSGTSIFGLPETSMYSLSKASLQSLFECLHFEFYKKNIYFKNFFTGEFDKNNSRQLSKKISEKIFSKKLNIYLKNYVYLAFILKIFPSFYKLLNIIQIFKNK